MTLEALVTKIKSVNTNTYEIVMVEAKFGGYYIIHGKYGDFQTSMKINDYKTAAFLFDIRMKELEGH